MGKKKEEVREYVWLKTEPKPYGLFDLSDRQAYLLVAVLLALAGILTVAWLFTQ